MPLHDHPRMLGILKALSGKVKIQSYTSLHQQQQSSHNILVEMQEPIILDQNSPASQLDEVNHNFHEISALEGPAAFFDILSPPYSDFKDHRSDARHCQFYRKLMVENSSERKVLRLEQIECPAHYYCDQVDYVKPEFIQQ